VSRLQDTHCLPAIRTSLGQRHLHSSPLLFWATATATRPFDVTRCQNAVCSGQACDQDPEAKTYARRICTIANQHFIDAIAMYRGKTMTEVDVYNDAQKIAITYCYWGAHLSRSLNYDNDFATLIVNNYYVLNGRSPPSNTNAVKVGISIGRKVAEDYFVHKYAELVAAPMNPPTQSRSGRSGRAVVA
jgi:hypothetical protein